jgi:hypothetical protein
MDLVLTPVSLRLKALVTLKIKLIFVTFRKVLFKFDIWRYSTPSITARLIDVSTKEQDESPPEFSPAIESEDDVG